MPTILAFRGLRIEDHEFEDSLDYNGEILHQK
jgi:hypothetical protein